VIDLHLHTTASDGRSTTDDLVDEALRAGLRTIAVTDHDTFAALPAVALAASAAGLECVVGIEITAVHAARDVHVLGYFVDPSDAELNEFLRDQREVRRRRALAIGEELERLGISIDMTSLVPAGESGRAVGRPLVAAALVAAGHARDIADAFDRYLAEGRPAYVERRGESPADVIGHIRRAGGLASLAHPGKLGVDSLVSDLAAAGLAAIEVFHPDHEADDVARYQAMAETYGLLVTGGSDYHGPGSGRSGSLGRVVLPADAYAALVERQSG
jgi:predicted metal-dependent phosphoesterase TrpH